MESYCDVPDCNDPENPGFARLAFRSGKCSTHMKQLQRTGKTTTIAEKISDEERAIEAGTLMLQAEAEGEENYQKHRRAFLAAARALGAAERIRAMREAQERAAARGVRIGRPPKVSTETVVEYVRLFGNSTLVAKALRIDRVTVYRHLRRAGRVAKGKVSQHSRAG